MSTIWAVTDSTAACCASESPSRLLARSSSAGTNLLGPGAQRRDRRDDLARRLPVAEALGLLGDDRLRARRLPAAAREARRDNRLEVVDVVEEAPVELVDRRVEVARDGEVDQEQRPALAAAQEPPRPPRGEHGPARRSS